MESTWDVLGEDTALILATALATDVLPALTPSAETSEPAPEAAAGSTGWGNDEGEVSEADPRHLSSIDLAEVAPLDLASLEDGLGQLVHQLENLGRQLGRLLSGTGPYPLAVALLVAAAALALNRCRLRQMEKELAGGAGSEEAPFPWFSGLAGLLPVDSR
jgi:hypothetical protein